MAPRQPELSIISSTRIAVRGLRFMLGANGLGDIKRLVRWLDISCSDCRPYGSERRERGVARPRGGIRFLGILLR